ncbi:MAG: hypothetical protein B7Y26_00745 [Hydrogenophilales bacterium 16-64-46]|nr:MAG: hypothetical protein B7Z32_10145 [Hydrogenophilales bacterium 12-64-13]OYZ07149.1 MAG: hypothetical protein B7Y26_00745 [Hydrogenophilales bacterium 16-64-46]OZA37382.1 MAG: hypothetical protein B7X87_11740 [Hydrogenophilales bacterium 17-64-34]HQT00600.1 glycine zipper 2TM domain-containing protein [Thiobacillus sp.]
MKTLLHSVCLLGASCALGVPALAADFSDSAEVLSSTPVYQTRLDSRSVCRQTLVNATPDDATGRQIVGGILGGLLGSRFGHGDGRVAAGAVGAVAGSVIGGQFGDDGERWETRCAPADRPTRTLAGYDVTYRYRGHVFTTSLPYDPGARLDLDVQLQPTGRAG